MGRALLVSGSGGRIAGRLISKRHLRAVVLSWLLFPMLVSAYGQQSPDAPLVSVELSIRRPDGHPLVHAATVIKIFGGSPFLPRIPDVEVATDDQGIARFEIPAGVYSLSVKVREVGEGNLGATEFPLGKVVRLEMPPLAGYARVDVIVPSGCGDDVIVSAGSEQYTLPRGSSIFHLDDVPAGELSISAAINSGEQSWLYSPCSDFALVNVIAVQNLRVVLEPPPSNLTVPKRPDSKAQNLVTPEQPAHHEPVIWVRGTVWDDTGTPVHNATVYAVATYSGSMRMAGLTVTADTDADGGYEIRGESGLTGLTIALVATAHGHPPAWAWPELKTDLSTPAIQNLVLPSKGGKADIAVVRDGQPVKGATVALYLENASLQDVWARGGPNEAVLKVAYPVSTTDDQGIARFDNLLPGRYRVLATTAGSDAIRSSAFGLGTPGGREPSGAADGVPVQVGQTTNFKIKVFSQSTDASFKVLRESEKPYVGMGADQFGPVDSIVASSSETLDSSGLGQLTGLPHVGLWHLDFMFRDSPITFFPIYPPYFQASGTVALSPNLPDDPPILRARHVDAGSLRVVVQDSAGRPIHATVQIKRYSELMASGTTGDDGIALFKGLYTGDQVGTLSDQYVALVRAPNFLNDMVTNFGKAEDPLPAIKALGTREAFLDQKLWNQRVPLAIGKETTATVRAERLRYVYGVIHSTNFKPMYGTVLDVWQERAGITYGASLRILPGGEYVAGPFLPGEVKIQLWDAAWPRYILLPLQVDTKPDQPFRFDFDADKYPVQSDASDNKAASPSETQLPTGGQSYLGMGGITTKFTGASHLTGEVFLFDGTTPALGAQVFYYPRGSIQPTFTAITNAKGKLEPRGLWSGATGVDFGPQSSLDSPTLVAFLPGACGATIQTSSVHPDQPVHIVLPSPRSVEGKVTVAQASPAKRPGTLRILAAYQGRGVLNSILSISTTAGADGRFTLAGLTPGTYLVQAALDEIWLSPVITLHVSAGKMQPMHLDISPPGPRVLVQVRDRSGKPLPGHSITIDRSGPLAYLWPHVLITDRAGFIQMPTMEAGQHTILLDGETKPFKFQVPALPAAPVVLDLRTTF